MPTQLTPAEVQHVAMLARLKLTPAEVADFASQLGRMLDYFQVLNEVDTEDVEPMSYAVEVRNVFREDVVQPSLPRAEALMNAPKTDGQCFLVPQILDGG